MHSTTSRGMLAKGVRTTMYHFPIDTSRFCGNLSSRHALSFVYALSHIFNNSISLFVVIDLCTFLLDIFQRLRTIRSSRFILKDNIKSSSPILFYYMLRSRILSELGAGRLYLLINVRSRKERKARLPFF